MVNPGKNTALIIGGSSGLGLATAKRLADDGYDIVIIHRDSRASLPKIESELDLMRKAGTTVRAFNFDGSDPAKISEFCASGFCLKKTVKIVVHSIAKGSLKSMTGDNALSADDFLLTINAMAISLYTWVSALNKSGLLATGASVVAFTSEGSSKPWMNYAAVSAAKATLEAISRSIALEFAPLGIRCNCVQAGVTDTMSLRMIPAHEQLLSIAQARNPTKKNTSPEQVASVVSALCGREMEWVTGTIIKADGGESLQ